MKKEDFLKLIEDDKVTNRDGRFAIDLDYLLGKFDLEIKPEPVFDCWVNPMTGRAQSKHSIEKMEAICADLGFIPVPRYACRNTLNRLLKDVLENIRAQENLTRNLKNSYATVPHEQEIYPSEIFEIPQYEKDQGFSEEFVRALKDFFATGEKTSNRFIFTWMLPKAEGHIPIERRIVLNTWECKNGDVIIYTYDKNVPNAPVSNEISLKNIVKIELDVNSSIETLLQMG